MCYCGGLFGFDFGFVGFDVVVVFVVGGDCFDGVYCGIGCGLGK